MKRSTKRLLDEASKAIAWGIPDTESIGYSRTQLILVISKLKRKVEELAQYEERDEPIHELGP